MILRPQPESIKNKTRSAPKILFVGMLGLLAALFLLPGIVHAGPAAPLIPLPALDVEVRAAQGPQDVVLTLQIVALMTVLSLAPAIILMLTSFTRIVIVLGFIRNAMGVQQMPPNQVVVSLALFLTFFTMSPVWQSVYENALSPYMQGRLSSTAAWEGTLNPLRTFMFKQTRERELSLMVRLSKMERPQNQAAVPTHVLIPAYILSEIKTAFQMGVVIFIPFLVIDMIVASALMSMGMMMLPPMMIALPFKILLFVMADGWNLVVASLVTSFN